MIFSPSLNWGGVFFICACISVYHVKHLHLIEFQMLSGIVMKPGSYCYGNLCWEEKEGGCYMGSPQNPLRDILMFAFYALRDFCLFFLNCKYSKVYHHQLVHFCLF